MQEIYLFTQLMWTPPFALSLEEHQFNFLAKRPRSVAKEIL